MNGIRTFAALAVLTVVLGTTSARAQDTDRAAVALQRAIRVELVDGDLKAAIGLFEEIVARFSTERAVAATALQHLGQCYEKLGEPAARDVYERVLREYADQAELVTAARARLAVFQVEPAPSSPALHTELVWPEARRFEVRGGDVSPDGSLLVYVDSMYDGNLAVRNLATGESRRLTHTSDNGRISAYNSRISPDGRQVVYTWGRPDGGSELRLLPLQGDRAEPRTVWSSSDGSWAAVQDWFPSGDRVVAVVNSSGSGAIATVSIRGGVDGQVRQVRSIDWGGDPEVRVSPDGRTLAYSRSATREVLEKDIFLVAVDGSSESVVVQHAAHDELVAWSPGGNYLLFRSDRSGQPGLWAQRIQDTEAVGEPQLLIANLDVGAGLGITRDGTLHYSVRVSRRRLKIAALDIETGELLRPPVNVTDRFVGGNHGGEFSPDGETLVYVSDRRGWTQQAIVIRSLENGEERELPHELATVFRVTWRPDGEHLFVQGIDGRGRYGPFGINVATSQTRRLREVSGWVSFTPDGTQILLRNDDENPELINAYRLADGLVQALPGVFPGGRFSLSPDGRWIGTIPDSGGEIRLHAVRDSGDGDVL